MDSSSPNTKTGNAIRYYDALPMITAGLILVLYILAFFRAMEYVIYILPIATALAVWYLYRYFGRNKIRATALIETAVFIFICSGTVILTSDHVVRWWDDVNYWATDAKALYYLNGFTGRYGNVAPEFGDYPPAIQIAKWCLLKLSPGEYKEGLAYAGYSLMNMIFILPFMRVSDRVTSFFFSDKGKKAPALFINIIWMISIMLIPGIVNDVWSYGACADVTMGIVYGAMLLGIYEIFIQEDVAGISSYIKVALYGAITALCKNTGFIWVTFASILMIALTISLKKDERSWKNVLLTIAAVYAVQISWWANCIINRRIAKLTGALARTATGGGITMPDDASDKLRYYVLGFLKEPMHTTHTWALDISAFVMFMLLIAVLVAAILTVRVKKGTDNIEKTDGDNGRRLKIYLIYAILSGIAIYVIVLMSHMSIFASETQYGSSEVMAISISRYGAPFTIGTFMLAVCVLTDVMRRVSSAGDRRVILALFGAVVFILITTDYPAYAYMYGGYKNDADTYLQSREEMIDPEGREYIDYLNALPEDEYKTVTGHRVLFFRDGSRIHWLNDTYINYEVAPIATVYASYDEGMSAEEEEEIIRSSHASYVYRPKEGLKAVE